MVGWSADSVVLEDEDLGDAAVDLHSCYWKTSQISPFLVWRPVAGTPSKSLLPGMIGCWCRHQFPRSRFCVTVFATQVLEWKASGISVQDMVAAARKSTHLRWLASISFAIMECK